MKQGHSGNQSQSSDSQKYMKQYADYYRKYMPDVKNWSNSEEVRGDFVKKFAGDYQKYMRQGRRTGNKSESSDSQTYIMQYAGDNQQSHARSDNDQQHVELSGQNKNSLPIKYAAAENEPSDSKEIVADAVVRPQIFLASRTPARTSSR